MPVFCVITDAPTDGDGNLATTFITTDGKELFAGVDNKSHRMIGMAKTPVWTPGEVVILDGVGGRELCGGQRKPTKWFIGYETYSDLFDAIRRSRVVTQCSMDETLLPEPEIPPIDVQSGEGRRAEVDAVVAAIERMPKEQLEQLPIVKQLKEILDKGGKADGN